MRQFHFPHCHFWLFTISLNVILSHFWSVDTSWAFNTKLFSLGRLSRLKSEILSWKLIKSENYSFSSVIPWLSLDSFLLHERTSEWPSTYVPITCSSKPPCERGERDEGVRDKFSDPKEYLETVGIVPLGHDTYKQKIHLSRTHPLQSHPPRSAEKAEREMKPYKREMGLWKLRFQPNEGSSRERGEGGQKIE